MKGPAEQGVGEPACAHCGLPVPPSRRNFEGNSFCCAGCEVVYTTIREHGLERYYALRAEQADRPALPASGADFDAFDDPSFAERHVRRLPDGTARTRLLLEGVHCAACVWLVERLPRLLEGVLDARLDVRRRVVEVAWDPEAVPLSRIARELDRLGYPPHPHRASAGEELRLAERRRRLVDLGVAGACAGNAMGIAFALYGGMLNGIDPSLRLLFRAGGLALTLVAVAWPGRVFFRGALAALRSGVAHMDLPVAVALAAGTVWGAVNTLRNAGHVYFESITGVIFLLLAGRYLQQRREESAYEAVSLLYRVTPGTARAVEADGRRRAVPVEALRPGMRIELLAGETVPADGRILRGQTSFDLSFLTGESRPCTRGPGATVHAGAVNLGGPVLVEVTAAGEETRVGRLMRLVEGLAQERAPVVRLADRWARGFVLAVLAAAALCLAVWWPADPSRAVENAIALLIVSCPCALGLATPLAVLAAIGRAARAGILVKGGTALERLARPGAIFLDKTGTVTSGRLEVVSWHGNAGAKSCLAAIEEGVEHPVARALREFCGGPRGWSARSISRAAGRGVEARVTDPEGRERVALAGTPDLVRGRTGAWPSWVDRAVRSCTSRGQTPVVLAIDGKIAAVAGLGDPVRPEAERAVRDLRRLGWEVFLLSGDHPRVARAAGAQLGLPGSAVTGGATPERKARIVSAARRRWPTVVMVGDGVNDAAALAAATVGIAAHGSAEASFAAADIALQRPGLDGVVTAVRGARRTLAAIRRNLIVSAAYNLVAAALAMAGAIDPLVAAVLMPMSSLTVLTLSHRARTFPAAPA
ncbi:MAG: heavy metal translocating P-type ATPase [Acidobacteria bacterium]|nr:MAG: heavy metal translocating P-type ATPase [Acidobacteriota bacterium]